VCSFLHIRRSQHAYAYLVNSLLPCRFISCRQGWDGANMETRPTTAPGVAQDITGRVTAAADTSSVEVVVNGPIANIPSTTGMPVRNTTTSHG